MIHFDKTEDSKKYVTVELIGGLGNRLFQLAAAQWYAKTYNKLCVISFDQNKPNSHSKIDYTKTIFSSFPKIDCFPSTYVTIQEKEQDFSTFVLYKDDPNQHTLLRGYFQSSKYIAADFSTLLNISECTLKYKSFLHVRRGDFLQFSLHNINLMCYFQYLLNKHKEETFLLLSDDIEWCRKQYIFQNCYFHEFKTELETMSFMKQCDKVAICANSTFSFWGSALSKCQVIYLPKPWVTKICHLELDLDRTQWIDSSIWCWPIYNVNSHPSEYAIESLRDGLMKWQTKTDHFKQCEYALFIIYPDVAFSGHERLQQAAKEIMNFDMIVVHYKGRVQTEFIKSTLVFKLRYIQEPSVFLWSSTAAKKWLENPNWNQFSRNFLLKI